MAKAKLHTEVRVTELPKCDFCASTAHYDGRTTMGPWAYMCDAHFRQYGVGLGLGYGQKLVVKNPRRNIPLIKRIPKVSEVSEVAYLVKDLVTEQDMVDLRPYLGTEFVSRKLREIADRRALSHNLDVYSALIELTPFKLQETTAYGDA